MLCECSDHAWKPIGRGFVALVSPSDACLLDYPWHASIRREGSASPRRPGPKIRGRRATIYLSHQVGGQVADCLIDHANGNPCDNRRGNLRFCSILENNRNTKVRKNKATDFKGVGIQGRRYNARIRVDGKLLHLGRFDTQEQAAQAYDAAAAKFFGAFARTNFGAPE